MIEGEISYPQTNLTDDILGKDGCFLSDFIQHQGDSPPLKEIKLNNYSMPESKWTEFFRFTSTCKYLKHLNMWSCKVGEAGRYLAQSVTSWGDNPPLQVLYLHYCSIPEQVWAELLQSLSSCKQLTDLRLLGNTIGEAGRYLAQSIRSWGDDPPLQKLNLGWCSIPEQVWPELSQSLSSCKEITDLNLSGNAIGEAGRYLAQSITSWGDNPPLQRLQLYSSSIPEQVWPELLQSLSSCRKLSNLDLSANTLTGSLSNFLPDQNARLTSLEYLYLDHTAMNKSDIQHLTHLVQANRLPNWRNVLTKVKNELNQLKKLLQVQLQMTNLVFFFILTYEPLLNIGVKSEFSTTLS